MAPRTPLLVLLLAALATSLRASLAPFGSCAKLAAHFRAEALARVSAEGLPGTAAFRREKIASEQPSAPTPGSDFSETNVQVAGVDEPDVVKTDGARVFVLRGRTLFVATARSDGASGKVTGRLTLPTFASELLLERDRLLVIAPQFRSFPRPLPVSARLSIPFFGRPQTVIYQVSVARPRPRLLATLTLDGRYVSAREVAGVARIVTSFDPTPTFPFRFASGPSAAKARKANEALLRSAPVSAWLPRFSLSEKGANTTGFVTPCANVFRPTVFTGFALLSVTTLPLAGRLLPRTSVAVTAEGRDIYATADALYVATTRYRFDIPSNDPAAGPAFTTAFHKFALSPTAARYVASGSVAGSVLNQFSMHEFGGVFFIATTLGAPWWARRDPSVSKVSSFEPNRARRLVKKGEVGNLGVGERIFAVRYVADVAYVVTFRQIDPFYIVDLSNPADLKVTGELKIPGFSSYLHFVKPGRVLGVGQEATPEGRTTGAKVTLFDVSDMTAPVELSTWTLPGGFSNVQWDHRAFLFWPPESVAVLPVSVFSQKNGFVGSVVLEISDSLIAERGRVEHKKCCGKGARRPSVERNFILGRTHLWSLSAQQLQVNNIVSLDFEKRIRLKPKE